MIGRVGDDDFGRALKANLNVAGVDTTYVLSDGHAATGIALIAVEDGGQNTIIVAAGANANVSRTDVDAARRVIASSQVLMAQLEVPLDTVTYAMDMARSAHILTLLNPAPAQDLSPELLARVDMIVPNETEAGILTGIPVKEWESAEWAALELNRRGVPIVVITLGARGALASDKGLIHRVPAFPVHAVDATAAGDAFVGALAVAWARGRELPSAMRQSNAAGALATLKLGAQLSLPTRAELEEFLQANPII
jgi:ribokinase